MPTCSAARASAPFHAGLGSAGDLDGELVMAGAQAHNRWLEELCAASPERRCGVATVPILHDIDAAVAEIERLAAAGFRAILIPTLWVDKPSYNDLRYEPVWAACEANGMVVHVHSGGASRDIAIAGAGPDRHLRDRSLVVGGPAVVGHALGRRLRTPSRACGSPSPRTALGGSRAS